jgi:prolyl-tRNA editing enzyme YbaK/EbsC (Cys-tRNA(Pro) deacylase)
LPELPRSARRVQEALRALGLPGEVRDLDSSARTAPEAAASVGCELGAIVKSLVFRGRVSGRGVLVLASGANRVDEKAVARLAGEAIERADADFVREQTGFAIGGVPPLGHAAPLACYVDEDLLRLDALWAAAGHPHAVFALTPRELVAMTGGTVSSIAKR